MRRRAVRFLLGTLAATVALWHGEGAAGAGDDLGAARAGQALAVHCASCHGPQQAENHYRDGIAGSILDLEALARDPHLVVPGNPDASRLYNVMLLRQMPPPAESGTGRALPQSEDIAAVRRWIAGLSPAPACTAVSHISLEALARQIATDLQAQRQPQQIRYVTFTDGRLTCDGRLAPIQVQAEIQVLLERLQRGTRSLRVTPVGASSAVFRFDLAELGWPAAAWERLVSQSSYRMAPRTLDTERLTRLSGSMLPYLRADELAGRFADAQAAGGKPDQGLGTSVLARHYARDLDLRAAAAELGIPAALAADELARAHGGLRGISRRLAAGTVPRSLFAQHFLALVEQLTDARIIGGAGRPGDLEASRSLISVARGAADLAIFADRPVYRQGELMTFNVSAGRDCRVQVTNVDAGGQATVLYPNDFQRARVLRAGEVLDLPGTNAPYQLRADRAGQELLIAECLSEAEHTAIRHNFSSQRFTRLGSYDAFLEKLLVQSAPKPGAHDGWRARAAFRIEVR